MELQGKLASNYTSKVTMLPNVLNNDFIKFKEQYLHILTNNDRLNGIKGSTKMKKRE